MNRFVFTMHPARVLFGSGTRSEVRAEIETLAARRVLVIATPEQSGLGGEIAGDLGTLCAGTFFGARMHTPVEVTDAAMEAARGVGADCLLAVGGGSTTGLGKALALRSGLPLVALPTTYAGSEMTPILGETEGGAKVTRVDRRVLPRTVIYDVDLTMTLPVPISVASGMNAMAHSVEALYARDGNPVMTVIAGESIRALAEGLRGVCRDPGDRGSRERLLYGAWLAGICLGLVGMALHHKLCHVLGGRFDLPHAQTHAVLLPHVVAYNGAAAPLAMAQLARALGTDEAVAGLSALVSEIGAPVRLADLGMPAEGIEEAAGLATRNPYWNPRPVTAEGMRDLLSRAHAGELPLRAY